MGVSASFLNLGLGEEMVRNPVVDEPPAAPCQEEAEEGEGKEDAPEVDPEVDPEVRA